MAIWLTVSALLNCVLLLVCVMAFRRYRALGAHADTIVKRAREERLGFVKAFDAVRASYRELRELVADGIREIKRDLDRNYGHVHDGHVLDAMATALSARGGPEGLLVLDISLEEQVRAAGGEAFISPDKTMTLSACMNFGWRVHATGRRHAGAIYAVVKESCGPTDRAAWLGKTLALWERICGWDKSDAIESLTIVIDQWKHSDGSAQNLPVHLPV